MLLFVANTTTIADIEAEGMPESVIPALNYLMGYQDLEEGLNEHLYCLLDIPEEEYADMPADAAEWIQAAAKATNDAGCAYTRFINF